ncbi:MAG: ATP-binding protein [Clostridia bacterium]|nr:ATP-binding protein [Clostridia bacterium]
MAELTVLASVDNLNQVLAFIDAELEKADCPMKTQLQIDVAVEELFVNIALYAYTPDSGSATIRTTPTDNPPAMEITFIDSGVPYDPLAKPDPDVTLSAEDRQIGGLGIYMVKKSMDDMKYQYQNGQNILTIKKNLR